MRILFFPTRFYPAISGGDFYIQRIAEELKRKKDVNGKKLEIALITTDGIDFGSLRGKGIRRVKETHSNYVKYRNLKVLRYNTIELKDKVSALETGQVEKYKEDFIELCQTNLSIDGEIITGFIKNGPILPELNYELIKNSFMSKLDEFYTNQTPFDLIHCSYLPYSNLIYSLIISRIYKIPAICTPFLHDENIRYQSEGIFSILREFDALIACTQYEKDVLIKNGIYSDNIFIIPMGVDIKKFSVPKVEIVDNIYQLSGPIILFCGYKNFEKGALTLLNSIPIITQEWKGEKPLNFVMIGPTTKAYNAILGKIKRIGEEKQLNFKVINLTPSNLSGIFDPKKIGFFQKAEIYCMPSRSEAYGIAYLEAWSTHTAVIASNFPAMQEVVNDKVDGLLVDFDNIEDLTSAILYLLKNRQEREDMGNRGFKKINSQNDWSVIVNKTYKMYQKLLDDKRD